MLLYSNADTCSVPLDRAPIATYVGIFGTTLEWGDAWMLVIHEQAESMHDFKLQSVTTINFIASSTVCTVPRDMVERVTKHVSSSCELSLPKGGQRVGQKPKSWLKAYPGGTSVANMMSWCFSCVFYQRRRWRLASAMTENYDV